VPGLCRKIHTNPGITCENPLSHPLNDHYENLNFAPAKT
jgi:hypothetical protein